MPSRTKIVAEASRQWTIVGLVCMLLLLPTTAFTAGPECDYMNWKWPPWKSEWISCPSAQTCEWLAYPRECRHTPPWLGEKCTIFSGGLDDPLNFCKEDDNYCKGFTDALAGTCTEYSKVGEACDGIQTLCANILGNTGRMCRPQYYFIDGYPSYLSCFPNWRTFDLSSDEQCRSAYSKSVHEKVRINYEDGGGNSIFPMTVSYSSGLGGSVVYGETQEVGVVYSGDGIYACFTSSCKGFGASVGENSFVSQGIFYNSYEDFKRGNFLTGFSVDALLAGVSYAAVRDGSEKVGDLVTYWAGLVVGVPFPSVIWCDTEIKYEYTWNPSKQTLESTMPYLECANTSECADAATCLADVSISARPGAEPVAVEQNPPGPYVIGSHDVTLQAVSGQEAVSCSATAEVVDCTPPDLTCPTIIAECTSSEGVYIDPPAPTFTDCSDVKLELPEAKTYPLGTTEVLYYGMDSDNNQGVCQATIAVVDTTAPRIESLAANPSMLWPPNHKMRRIALEVNASDACAEVNCKVVGITTNELDDGKGDGSTVGDAFILDAKTVALRAERAGAGNGRVYTITVECTDAAGNAATETIDVSAPHNRKETR